MQYAEEAVVVKKSTPMKPSNGQEEKTRMTLSKETKGTSIQKISVCAKGRRNLKVFQEMEGPNPKVFKED